MSAARLSMEHRSPNTSSHRSARTVLLGLALVALLALVAAVSRAHRTPGTRGGVHRPPAGVSDYLFTIFVLGALVGTAFVLWLWFSERDLLAETRKKRQGRGTYRVIFLLILLGFIAAMVARFLGPDLLRKRQSQANPLGKTHFGPRANNGKKQKAPSEPAPPQLQWLPIVLATGAGMILLGYIGVRTMRRQRGELVAQHLLEQQFESLLDETLDDLYRQKDPRVAIIAAYARMEQLFASAGLPRHESEAPLEYLGRALGELRASGAALGRLTGLFQWAKFSSHEVDERMRLEAIEALTEVRDELRARREEDKAERERAERFRQERLEAGYDAERGRTFGEDPFEAASASAKGSIWGRRGV